jgi:hypothetical protein
MKHWYPALGLPLGLNIMEAGIMAGRRSRIWTWLPCKKHWKKRCHLLQV